MSTGYFIDRTGERYGRLTVIKRLMRPDDAYYTDALWLCKCDCGNETAVRSSSLGQGNTRSCGCLRREFVKNQKRRPYRYAGMQCGKIKLIDKIVKFEDATTHVYWECECECGNNVRIRPMEIRKYGALGCEKCRGENG